MKVWRCYRDSSWKDSEVYRKAFDITNKKLPNAWSQEVMTEDEIREWLKRHYPEGTPEWAAYYSINPKAGPARGDLWRLLVIYVHGGLYLDIKSALVKPLPPLGKEMQMSRWNAWETDQGKHEMENWYIYSPPKNPVIRYFIDQVVKNLQEESRGWRDQDYYDSVQKALKNNDADGSLLKIRILFTTGPRALTLLLDKLPDNLKSFIKEKKSGLDGALRYNVDEGNTWSHTQYEGKKHYSKLLYEPLCIDEPSAANLFSSCNNYSPLTIPMIVLSVVFLILFIIFLVLFLKMKRQG